MGASESEAPPSIDLARASDAAGAAVASPASAGLSYGDIDPWLRESRASETGAASCARADTAARKLALIELATGRIWPRTASPLDRIY